MGPVGVRVGVWVGVRVGPVGVRVGVFVGVLVAIFPVGVRVGVFVGVRVTPVGVTLPVPLTVTARVALHVPSVLAALRTVPFAVNLPDPALSPVTRTMYGGAQSPALFRETTPVLNEYITLFTWVAPPLRATVIVTTSVCPTPTVNVFGDNVSVHPGTVSAANGLNREPISTRVLPAAMPKTITPNPMRVANVAISPLRAVGIFIHAVKAVALRRFA